MGKETRSPVISLTCSIFVLLLFPLLYTTLFRPNFSLLDSWNSLHFNLVYESLSDGRNPARKLQPSGLGTTSIKDGMGEDELLSFLLRRLVRGRNRMELDTTGFSCDTDLHADVCVIKDPVRIDSRTLTVYLSSNLTLPHMQRTVRPYARKHEESTMLTVSPVELVRNTNSPPQCDVIHDVPAVVFSSSGFTGNLFHEFNEIIIPLFLTSRHFRSQLKFMITDFKPWWVSKYRHVLTHLSNDGVINPAEDGRVHCFPGAVVGLKYHGHLTCNTTNIPGGYSMIDFRHFVRESFGLKIKNKVELETKKPILMLISRRNSRKFLNENDMVRLIRELGFHLVIATPNQMSNLHKFANLVNSCSVLVGAYGAGLTNAVFLPEGAVVIQVVPLGLDWPSTEYFGRTVPEMGLHYLEYLINPDESSLTDKYGRDDPIITDPASINMQGYNISRAIYIDGQNLRLGQFRFRQILVEAMGLLGHTEVSE